MIQVLHASSSAEPAAPDCGACSPHPPPMPSSPTALNWMFQTIRTCLPPTCSALASATLTPSPARQSSPHHTRCCCTTLPAVSQPPRCVPPTKPLVPRRNSVSRRINSPISRLSNGFPSLSIDGASLLPTCQNRFKMRRLLLARHDADFY